MLTFRKAVRELAWALMPAHWVHNLFNGSRKAGYERSIDAVVHANDGATFKRSANQSYATMSEARRPMPSLRVSRRRLPLGGNL